MTQPYTPAQFVEETKMIFKKYISTAALFQVNISDKQRLAITQELEKIWKSELAPNPKIFDRAQSEVFQLMFGGPYPRFRVSPFAEQMKAEVFAEDGKTVVADGTDLH